MEKRNTIFEEETSAGFLIWQNGNDVLGLLNEGQIRPGLLTLSEKTNSA